MALQRSCIFSKTIKKCSIDLTPQVELAAQRLQQRSCTRVIYSGHVQGSYPLSKVICIYKLEEFNSADSLRIKCNCQLVVRLKANKCYQRLLCYLSFYIILPNIRFCNWLQAPGWFQIFSP